MCVTAIIGHLDGYQKPYYNSLQLLIMKTKCMQEINYER